MGWGHRTTLKEKLSFGWVDTFRTTSMNASDTLPTPARHKTNAIFLHLSYIHMVELMGGQPLLSDNVATLLPNLQVRTRQGGDTKRGEGGLIMVKKKLALKFILGYLKHF